MSDINEQITLICAFRYALGRMSYAVGAVVDTLLDKWDDLKDDQKNVIYTEIKEAEAKNGLGMDMDKRDWMRVINRYEEEFNN